MTNDEWKKKITEILEETEYEWTEEKNGYILQIFYDKLAAALIAAGIGDLKEHRIFAGKDGSIKQLYSGEEVEKIVKERKELKDELRSKVEYIQEQDEVIKEYKHRAEVAERALFSLVHEMYEHDIRPMCDEKFFIESRLIEAEKEIAEERKDDR